MQQKTHRWFTRSLVGLASVALSMTMVVADSSIARADEPSPTDPTTRPVVEESPTPDSSETPGTATPTQSPSGSPTAEPTSAQPSPDEASAEAEPAGVLENSLKDTSPSPLFAGENGELTARFGENQPGVEVWGEVWLPWANRWSRTASVRTDRTGQTKVALTWNPIAGTQRWRATARLIDGSLRSTPEVTIRRAAAIAQQPKGAEPGQDVTLSGTFDVAQRLSITPEVWIPSLNRWSRAATTTTAANGSFSVQLTWSKEHHGTQTWRVAAQLPDGRVVHTNETSVLRRRKPSVSRLRTLTVGQGAWTWGNFQTSEPITVWGEVWRTDVQDWSRSASVRSASDGDYSININFDIHRQGTQRWRIAGRHADGTIQYTDEFSVVRRPRPTVSKPRVLPARYPMHTFGNFPTDQPITYWGEVWRTDGQGWSRTAQYSTSRDGDYTLDLSYGNEHAGTLRWRIAGRYPDGSVVYTDEFTVHRTSPMHPSCMTGRVMCATKDDNRLWWVVNGQILESLEARFGKPGMDTREGMHTVKWKSRYHTSSIYNVYMPYAMFFNGGQAVHYSPGFAATGHIGAGSAGCINVRDEPAIARIYDQVRVGDRVFVYR